MKKIIGVCLLLVSINSHAKKSSTILNRIACTNNVLSTISSIGTPIKWKKVDEFSVSSTMETGERVTLKSRGEVSKLNIEAKNYKVDVTFESPKCQLKINDFTSIGEGFSDENLTELISSNTKGAILLWSPHMSLSVYELVEMQEYLKSLKIPIKVLLDTNADKDFSKNILKKYDLPLQYLERMNSRNLEKFGINVHFPSIVFYKNKKLVKRVPGYNSEVKLNHLIKKYLD
jgi:hypothetical protein